MPEPGDKVLEEAERILAETAPGDPAAVELVSDQVFNEIAITIEMNPEEALKVNSVFLFVIKLAGSPVKRWRK
jgi:hypothetical protein